MSEEKEVKKVITGDVKKSKKSFATKLIDTFVSEDAETIKDYLINDVAIPKLKTFILDIWRAAGDSIFGGVGSNRTNYSSGNRFVNYSSISNAINPPKSARYDSYNFEEFVFGDRSDAEAVLDTLIGLIDDYESVTVGDYYQTIGQDRRNHTDREWGWTDLSSARVDHINGGYAIRFPRVKHLEK